MIHDPITITNVLQKTPSEVSNYLNVHILNTKIPQYTANHPVNIQHDLVPLLSHYANCHCYATELYCVVIGAYFEQKSHKRTKNGQYDEGYYTDLEAKKEILYRVAQTLDRLYEATSRIMTGIGEPDPRQNRHP